MQYPHQTITSYRTLPPRWKYVNDEFYSRPADRHLAEIDVILLDAQARVTTNRGTYGTDLVSMVFANQAVTHEVGSQHLAHLIHERKALAEKHLTDIQWRLDALLERRPLRHRYSIASPQQERLANEMERQILDLEKQKRDVHLTLWRDTLELRQSLLTERQEYRETRRRMAYLSGPTWISSASDQEGKVDDTL
ncbi:MAG: hypothetical protein HQ495_06160 [Alphaproteobacteria bacterium]|nr:hypothetical protein [Alphaproteobacteria bacterium]